MSSTTLIATRNDLLNRALILFPQANTEKTADDKNISKASSSTRPFKQPSDGPPLRAYLRIVGICCVLIEPSDGTANMKRKLFGEEAADSRKLPLLSILQLLASPYEQLMAKHETQQVFIETGEEEPIFTPELQQKVIDLLLKLKNNNEEPIQQKIILIDPHTTNQDFPRWTLSRLEGETSEDVKKNIVFEILPEDFFLPKLRYTRPIFSSFDAKGVAERIMQSNRIVVATGAGLSRGAVGPDGEGIPDFRSEGGLYSKLEKYNLPTPESIFTLDYFRKNPDLFYKVAEEMRLWPGAFAPSYGHHFIKLLEKRGKLAMNFTQNIDTLERVAQISADKIVEAHGSFATASCVGRKKHPMSTKTLRETVEKGEVPKCAECGEAVKPDVVFFGESLPHRFIDKLETVLPAADLVLVLGTSLQVFPFAFVAATPERMDHTHEPRYPRVLMNMERVGEFCTFGDRKADNENTQDIFDCVLTGDCQKTVRDIAKHMGMEEELENAYQDGLKRMRASV